MNHRSRLILVAVFVLVCLGAVLTAYAQMQKPAAHQVWEYKDGANLQINHLNKLGEDGWELVQVVTYGRDYYYLLKRPR
jgi:hypothetical protein